MHVGVPSGVPVTADRSFDLGRKLKQQAIIGLFRDRLDAERQPMLMRRQRQRNRGKAAQIGERGEGEVAPEIAEPVLDGRIVADGEEFGGADFRRRQRGDRGEDDVPLVEECAEAARGGANYCALAPCGRAYSVSSKSRSIGLSMSLRPDLCSRGRGHFSDIAREAFDSSRRAAR